MGRIVKIDIDEYRKILKHQHDSKGEATAKFTDYKFDEPAGVKDKEAKDENN